MLLLRNLSGLFIAYVLMITTLVWPCFSCGYNFVGNGVGKCVPATYRINFRYIFLEEERC